MDNIFNKEFWLNVWEKDKESDTYSVHKGFSTPEYWDKAAGTYNRDKKEVANRRLEKTIDLFKRSDLLFDGMSVLDIGCGTGMLAMELAKNGAHVTAIDFSKGMLEKFNQDLSMDMKKNITILYEDWYKVDIEKRGWKNNFDLVVAFMSPGVASSESFFKMMDCSKKGCAVRGWAAKRNHPVLSALWEKIMGATLEDKPQSVLFKLNLLFSIGFFPEITFDKIEWVQSSSIKQEFDSQMEFFKNVSDMSDKALEKIIQTYLESICEDKRIIRKHQGLTATAVWKIDSRYS